MRDSAFYIVSIELVRFALLADDPKVGDILKPSHPDHREISGQNHPRNAWLFQSNPVLYNLRGALDSLKEQVWSVSRYAKQIEIGDRIYLWEAGPQGGIVGVAEIVENVRLQPEPREQLPFAKASEAFAGNRLRTRLRILKVFEPVIPRRSIISIPELRELGVLRCSRGTNFRLSLDQWYALNGLSQRAAALIDEQERSDEAEKVLTQAKAGRPNQRQDAGVKLDRTNWVRRSSESPAAHRLRRA